MLIDTVVNLGYIRAYDLVKSFVLKYDKDTAIELFKIDHSKLNHILESTYWLASDTLR